MILGDSDVQPAETRRARAVVHLEGLLKHFLGLTSSFQFGRHRTALHFIVSSYLAALSFSVRFVLFHPLPDLFQTHYSTAVFLKNSCQLPASGQ